jgi:hypothetical protein
MHTADTLDIKRTVTEQLATVGGALAVCAAVVGLVLLHVLPVVLCWRAHLLAALG